MSRHLALSTCVLLSAIFQCINGEWKPVAIAAPLSGGSTEFQSKSSLPLESISYHGSPLIGSLGIGAAPPAHEDQCSLHKVAFTQDLYFQYIQYKQEIPKMKEFTLCMWTKFHNHSNDHPLFSYAVDHQPRAILAWISNTDRSSYYSLSVAGHTFFRLNYPIRLNKWYHSCHSWNGRTGEWQLWINAERVGRGFHNRLVDHVIPGGGIAITGQEQRQLGGGFLEGEGAPKGSGGMLGEVTMVQLYHVALTAGKAHKDHKHHHAHTFLHEGVPTTTTTPRTPAPRPQPTHPLLTGGQINNRVRLNFAGGQPQQPQPPQQPSQPQPAAPQPPQVISEQYFNLISSGPAGGILQGPSSGPNILPSNALVQLPSQVATSHIINNGIATSSVHSSINPANVQFIDVNSSHQIFKRNNKEEKTVIKRDTAKNHSKRGLFVSGGAIFDDSLLAGGIDTSLLEGLAGFDDNQSILQQQKASDEREPAEAEVKAVMAVCNGCDHEPFEKALVLGWRTVPKKLYSGAYLVAAVPECKAF